MVEFPHIERDRGADGQESRIKALDSAANQPKLYTQISSLNVCLEALMVGSLRGIAAC